VITLACVFSLSTTSHGAIDDGLVSYWPLDGNFVDTQSGNNGTLMGANTTPSFTAGKLGQGIDLDGVDQFIQIGGDESQFDFLNQDFSISAWFRVDALTKDWQALIAKGEGNRWRVHRRGGEDELTWNGGNADVPNHDTPIDDGQFHHFVGVSMQGAGVQLWQDGVLRVTGPAPANSDNNNANPVKIGANPDTNPNRSWDGVIDDVGIWGRALSAEEIAQLYNGGAGATIPQILGVVGEDVNGDGAIDILDYEIIRDHMRQSPATQGDGDVNFDGTVDLRDFRAWKEAFNAAPAAVPEPGALGLLLLAAALLGVRSRTRRDAV
jgi:hypothetical protein